MCEHGSKIRFCSCDVDALEPPFPYWVLYREVGQSRMEIVGLFLPPEEPSALDQVTIQAVSDALNDEGSFDFEYSAQLNDSFVLHLSENQEFGFTCEREHGAGDNALVWCFDYCPIRLGDDFEVIESGKLVAK